MYEEHDEHPPFFRKWSHWYWLVLLVLAVEIILFFIITKKSG